MSEKEFALTRFDSIDLAAIHERVKHLGIIGHSRGYIYKVTLHARTYNKTRHSETHTHGQNVWLMVGYADEGATAERQQEMQKAPSQGAQMF